MTGGPRRVRRQRQTGPTPEAIPGDRACAFVRLYAPTRPLELCTVETVIVAVADEALAPALSYATALTL